MVPRSDGSREGKAWFVVNGQKKCAKRLCSLCALTCISQSAPMMMTDAVITVYINPFSLYQTGFYCKSSYRKLLFMKFLAAYLLAHLECYHFISRYRNGVCRLLLAVYSPESFRRVAYVSSEKPTERPRAFKAYRLTDTSHRNWRS